MIKIAIFSWVLALVILLWLLWRKRNQKEEIIIKLPPFDDIDDNGNYIGNNPDILKEGNVKTNTKRKATTPKPKVGYLGTKRKEGASAKELYQTETGDIEPDSPMAYHSWYQRYVIWLENQVENLREDE